MNWSWITDIQFGLGRSYSTACYHLKWGPRRTIRTQIITICMFWLLVQKQENKLVLRRGNSWKRTASSRRVVSTFATQLSGGKRFCGAIPASNSSISYEITNRWFTTRFWLAIYLNQQQRFFTDTQNILDLETLWALRVFLFPFFVFFFCSVLNPFWVCQMKGTLTSVWHCLFSRLRAVSLFCSNIRGEEHKNEAK